MRMTLRKKLIGSYMCLSVLVLLAGLGSIVILGKVSKSADLVSKVEMPTQYAVLQTALALDKAQGSLQKYLYATSDIEAAEKEIIRQFEEFDMWLDMLDLGSDTPEFRNSPAGTLYASQRLSIIVPRVSETLRQTTAAINAQGHTLKDGAQQLFLAQRQNVQL